MNSNTNYNIESCAKQSHRIGRKGAQTLYYAFEQAERIGLPLTCHATIDFASTHCDPTQAVSAFARLRQKFFGEWARKNRFKPTGAYAFENVRNGIPFKAIGPGEDHHVHVHWAVHIPTPLIFAFERKLRRWIDRVTGGIIDFGTVLKITNPGKLDLRQYLLKGTDEVWASTYGAFAEPQGVITGGRRTSTTRNIGPKARRASDGELGKSRPLPQLYGAKNRVPPVMLSI